MGNFLGKYNSYFYALLRIVAGLLFALHGSQKLFGFPGGKDPVELASLMGVAGIIEFFGGLLIAVGLFTSIAAFIASGQMAVAYFMAHASENAWPLLNNGELSVLYCFLFLYIASRGSGIWSIDALLNRNTAAEPRVNTSFG
ncbi:DoxX family protein [Pontibacter arcticus]|uniref:DoxX family protein n=1 Tax=Pontibacter arcticus TaxID=2080288 RepID=A0A364RC47_9BACT|nr:DoxX family protein [Pontibacter arcticus]RAU81908.1 DoxX family protein [Pontibacter arcticus]